MHARESILTVDPKAGLAFQNDDAEAQLHADFNQIALVSTANQLWQASPKAGVWRKRLELIGSSTPRLTTLVKFDPNSHFDEHSHDGGEEFLVLDGTLSDESGDFASGSYVRNPIGSKHRPWTQTGCILLVKLRQFDPADQASVAINLNPATWQETAHTGVQILPLHAFGTEKVQAIRLTAKSTYRVAPTILGNEFFVLEGKVQSADQTYRVGDWLRLPARADPLFHSPGGAKLWHKSGHFPAETPQINA